MDHPLIQKGQKEVRRRVIQFFRKSYYIRRNSNIVFVCGGNEATDMRKRFQAFCIDNLIEFEFFEPEFAMKNYFREADTEPFDIADFEELVGELSHAIVVFPEAPGSFAETGYFSAINPLAQKTILALDSKHQQLDSFISLGPAKKITQLSNFQPVIQIDYANPNFDLVGERIRRVKLSTTKKTFSIRAFAEMEPLELFALLSEVVSLMSIATFDDLIFVLRGLFNSHLSTSKVKKIISILVGAEHLVEIGDFGHLTFNKKKTPLLELKDGARDAQSEIKISLAILYQDFDPEFVRLVEEARDVN